jgi:hypothetical protein
MKCIIFINIKSKFEWDIFSLCSWQLLLGALRIASPKRFHGVLVYIRSDIYVDDIPSSLSSMFHRLSLPKKVVLYNPKNSFGELIEVQDKPDLNALFHALRICVAEGADMVQVRPNWIYSEEFLEAILERNSISQILIGQSLPIVATDFLTNKLQLQATISSDFLYEWTTLFLSGKFIAALDFGKYSLYDFSTLLISSHLGMVLYSYHYDLLHLPFKSIHSLISKISLSNSLSLPGVRKLTVTAPFDSRMGYGSLESLANSFTYHWRGRVTTTPNSDRQIVDWIMKVLLSEEGTTEDVDCFLSSPFLFHPSRNSSLGPLISQATKRVNAIRSMLREHYSVIVP